MALLKQDVQAPAVQKPVTTKVKKPQAASEAILKKGHEILAAMDEEKKATLGSDSGTLHFQHLLGLPSKMGTRKAGPQSHVPCSTPVGVTLISDKDIDVPVIDITKNKDTGIDFNTDITYKRVKAGEAFDLSYYEFMYLILRDEYAGTCAFGDDPKGVYFSAKLPKFMKGEAKLPTPTINLKSGLGSIKANMVDIEEKGPDGSWVMKEKYKEKFGALVKRGIPRRASGASTPQTPTATVVAVALQKLLFK